MSVKKRQLGFISSVAALGMILVGLGSTSPANAVPSNPMVILNGRIQPAYYSLNNCVKRLMVSTPTGQMVGVGLGAGCYPSYSYAFTNVPLLGYRLYYTITYNTGTKSGSFILQRPFVGFYATVNLY